MVDRRGVKGRVRLVCVGVGVCGDRHLLEVCMVDRRGVKGRVRLVCVGVGVWGLDISWR